MRSILVMLGLAASSAVFAQSADSSAAYYQKGLAAKNERRYLVATQLFNKSLEFDPANTDARRDLGSSYLEMRRYPDAITAYNEVIRKLPEDTASISNLAMLYYYTRKWDQAIVYGNKMLQKKIGNNANYILGKSYYESEDYGHAFTYLQAAAKDDPNNAEIPYAIGHGYTEMSNYRAGAPFYEKAVQLDTTKPRWVYECALNFAAIPDDRNALKYYLLAADRGYRQDNDYYENLSISYQGLGQMDKCIELLKKVLEKKPGDLELLNTVADLHYKIGKYQEAMDYWDKILEFDKKNARALYMIGMCYQKKGDKAKGAQLCDQAIAMDPSLAKLKQQKN
ncbi:MAG: tetratricopeptide repeat protein [Bacteroidetes bacterium]|nr:tetratricopeptide repeat protein [Bacteroidota bacterium]